MAKGGSGMKALGSKRSSAFTGKSKVISSGALKGGGGRGGAGNHMFGRQSVKPAKAK
jgi:hypothetical protein